MSIEVSRSILHLVVRFNTVKMHILGQLLTALIFNKLMNILIMVDRAIVNDNNASFPREWIQCGSL